MYPKCIRIWDCQALGADEVYETEDGLFYPFSRGLCHSHIAALMRGEFDMSPFSSYDDEELSSFKKTAILIWESRHVSDRET